MQIDEATRQATAPVAKADERISSSGAVGAEIGAAACGQTKAGGLRQMDAVVERRNLWQAYERVMRNKGAAGVDGLTVSEFKARNNTGQASKQHCWQEITYRRRFAKWKYPSPMAGYAHWASQRYWTA